jgi:hypothetical protein
LRGPFEGRDEECAGEPDDVEVVAVDALDEAPAEALDGVRTGAPLPLAAIQVRVQNVVLERSEGDVRRRVVEDIVVAAEQAHARDDGMRPAGELAKDSLGVVTIGALPKTRPSRSTVVSTPSVTRPSRWTERAFPSAWRRTSSTASASGGSSST